MEEIKRIALIPAYEPEEIMVETAKSLRINGFSVVIVDDGSGEKYMELFNRAEEYAYVIHYPDNKGKGFALKTGFRYIKEKYDEPYTIVTVDADGQHKVTDVIKVCDTAEENRDSLTLGSRKFSGNVPLRSRFGNSVTRLVFRLSSGKKVYDTQTGLRAFSEKLLDRMLEIDGSRYEYEMNMLMSLASENISIDEVWIETVYLNDNSSSHFNPMKDSYRVYKEILKFSGSSFLCFCLDYIIYCIFLALTGILVFSNVAARVISSITNYVLNRKMVFKSKTSVIKSVLQYFGLAVFILLCNTALLKALTLIGLNGYFAKIPVELSMSVLSWMIQRRYIFKPGQQNTKIVVYNEIQNVENTVNNGGLIMKKHKWAIIYSLCLILFTTYISLNTFVMSSAYQKDAIEMNLEMFNNIENKEDMPESETESETESDQPSKKRPSGFGKSFSGTKPSKGNSDENRKSYSKSDPDKSKMNYAESDPDKNTNTGNIETVADGKTGNYNDENISITLQEYKYEGSSVYVADIKLSSAVYLKTAFANDTYGKNVTEKTSVIAKQNDAILAINGDYYGARENGCVIRNGIAYREAEGDTDILCIYADGTLKIADPQDVSAEQLVSEGVWQAFSFGPALVENGEICVSSGERKSIASENPRTAIGMIDKLHYIFVVCDGRTNESEGLTLTELAALMEKLGAKTAYNLDGGGSSSMVFNGEIVNNPTTTGSIKERSVSDIVYIG